MRAGTVCRAISGQIIRETDKAILFMIQVAHDGEVKSIWFPLSQLASIHRCYDEINETLDVLMASEWILGQNGVLKYAGAAGVNPVTVNAPVNKKENTKQAGMDTPAKNRYNRMPYKDDESPIIGDMDDDIPF